MNHFYRTKEEIETLVQSFKNCTLPRSEWTHAAHLVVGLWYIKYYPEPQAIQKIRDGIQRYNLTQGIAQTKDNGYHETMTLFWIQMIRQYVEQKSAHTSLVEIANELIQNYENPKLMFQYYSTDSLMSWEARLTWVEPDLKPLEMLPSFS